LSVLYVDSITKDRKVNHYLIKKDESNRFYIESKNLSNLRYFQSLDELLNFYKGNFYFKSFTSKNLNLNYFFSSKLSQ